MACIPALTEPGYFMSTLRACRTCRLTPKLSTPKIECLVSLVSLAGIQRGQNRVSGFSGFSVGFSAGFSEDLAVDEVSEGLVLGIVRFDVEGSRHPSLHSVSTPCLGCAERRIGLFSRSFPSPTPVLPRIS